MMTAMASPASLTWNGSSEASSPAASRTGVSASAGVGGGRRDVGRGQAPGGHYEAQHQQRQQQRAEPETAANADENHRGDSPRNPGPVSRGGGGRSTATASVVDACPAAQDTRRALDWRHGDRRVEMVGDAMSPLVTRDILRAELQDSASGVPPCPAGAGRRRPDRGRSDRGDRDTLGQTRVERTLCGPRPGATASNRDDHIAAISDGSRQRWRRCPYVPRRQR